MMLFSLFPSEEKIDAIDAHEEDSNMRLLADDEEEAPPPQWQLIYMSVLMVLLFAALITDRVAPDHVFVTALAFCIVSGIVDMKEGLGGFANEGVLTVMVRNSRVVLCDLIIFLDVPHN